ncbi:MAG TPA: polysaccharide biosynthesis/export family protein [Candidatus Sumerlaeota bacterium]|nr:polysaccharide biosynthesis/export family protein [Candidatus Sumerlaeota bacterium]
MKMRRPVRLRLPLAILLLLVGTAVAQPDDDATTAALRIVPAAGDILEIRIGIDPAPTGEPYRILVGDQLSLVFHFGWPPADEPYPIQPGDEIKLYFRYSPEISQLYAQPEDDRIAVLSRPYVVEPDGKLWLAGLAEPVQVAGKTTTQFAADLRRLYQDQLTSPQVQVSVTPMFEKQRTLKELFQAYEDRPVSFMEGRVTADGRIAAPLIPEITAAGKTPAALSAELTAIYHELGYPWTSVTVIVGPAPEQRTPPLEALQPPNGRVAIAEDGTFLLPFLPPQSVGDRSLAELAARLAEQYRLLGVPNPDVRIRRVRP